MALNKLALIRYKTIDDCLRNRARKWTLEHLIEKVSEALYEYEGIEDGVSRRTLQLDLQTMRSDKLYSAPIIVLEKKYYTYEDPKFSITQSKLTAADVQKMHEVVGMLKHLNGFHHFGEMRDIIAKLENNLNRTQTEGHNIIQFESNVLLRGLDWLAPLYKAVAARQALQIEYRSFRAHTSKHGVYYPYLLKEYRNRWFLIAKSKGQKHLLTLALDRIESVLGLPNEAYMDHPSVNFDHYFEDVLGVTKSETARAVKVILAVSPATLPYVMTKPIHPTQTVLKTIEHKTIIQIEVVPNFELERELLGFGPGLTVLGPRLLVKRIRQALLEALTLYQS